VDWLTSLPPSFLSLGMKCVSIRYYNVQYAFLSFHPRCADDDNDDHDDERKVRGCGYRQIQYQWQSDSLMRCSCMNFLSTKRSLLDSSLTASRALAFACSWMTLMDYVLNECLLQILFLQTFNNIQQKI